MIAPDKPKVTLTVEIGDLRDLFVAGNHSSGAGSYDDADPLHMALDIIEHAAMDLYTLHDALYGHTGRDEDLALHAWRVSKQLTAGIAVVQALNEATHRKTAKAAE